jgi:hypothetical protein
VCSPALKLLFLLSWAAPLVAAPHRLRSSSSPLDRVVPSEWASTITGTVNGTVAFGGLTHKSAAQQAVLVASASGHAKLWRADLLSTFEFPTGAAVEPTTCEREQLFSSEILLLLDFLLAPGTVLQSNATIRGRACDIWFNPFGGSYGKFVCLESVPGLTYQRPVRYWLKLAALDFVVDFEADFKELPAIPQTVFAVPAACPQPKMTQLPPLGLVDSFESGALAPFWMPPLAKYYTYEPEHITVRQGPARKGTHAAHVVVQPGDVRNGPTERDELDLPMLLVGGRELYYSWSFLLAEGFGFSDNRIVLSQWKQSSLFTQSPVIALRLKEHMLQMTVRNLTLEEADDDEVRFTLTNETRLGHWYDVTFGFAFSHSSDGFVKVWLDGREVATFTGPTMSRADQGYFDFHFGVYRDLWKANQTVLLDEFRVADERPSA